MSLPILNSPRFELDLPVSKKKISYRPFLVKEEKILLMALESQDQKQIMRAMHDIIDTCTYNEVKAKELPVSELEYLFLKIRSKSVGENSHIGVKCKSCEASNEMDINLDEIKLDVSDSIDNKIMLTDSVGVIMKYPTSDDVLRTIDSKKSEIENIYAVITASLDKIFDKESVHDVSTQAKQDVDDFVNSLNQQQFSKIKAFFDKLPKLKHNVKFQCEKCGTDNDLVLEGMESFFA
jgi:hypothetical protein